MWYRSYHDVLGLSNGLGIVTVVVLSVVDLNIVVGDIQKDLNNNAETVVRTRKKLSKWRDLS